MLNIRVSLFVYLSQRKGLDDMVYFSVPLFLDWIGYKSDSHKGAINDKVLETLTWLEDLEYITFFENKPVNKTTFIKIKFNTQIVHDECFANRFAIVYLDEIERIIAFKNKNKKDNYLNCNNVLLVFAFLRRSIFRTPNKLKPEERYEDRITDRKERCIETFNESYKDIGTALGLTEKTVSKAVKVLVQLKLIVIAEPYHIKDEFGNFITPDYIFANYEKREGTLLLASGNNYAFGEIKRKEKMMQHYFPDYHIRTIGAFQ